MTHAVMIPNAVSAMNVDALNRSAKSASDVDDGNIVILTGVGTGNLSEVWTAVVPSTSDGLTGVWMAGEPEVVLTASKYKGIDPDPRNYYNEAGKVFSVFKPRVGDIITLTADGLAGTKTDNTYVYVNATNSTGGLKPVWGTSQTSSVFSMKLLETTYISIADGSIGSQRVTAYRFVVVGE